MLPWILNLLQEDVMTLILKQTDAAAQDGEMLACYSGIFAPVDHAKQMDRWGAYGTIPVTVWITVGAVEAGFMLQSKPGQPGNGDWESGTWTIRLNVTSPNADIKWKKVYVCRVNSSGVNQEHIGSNVAVDQILSGAGVYTTTVSGAASPGAVESDEIYIVFAFENTSLLSSESIGITPDQDIDTPLVVPSAASVLSARPVFGRPFFRRPRFNRPGAWGPSFSTT